MLPSLEVLPVESIVSIDHTCDRFESSFRAGSQPKIEEFLSASEASIRRPLFRELLRLEIQLRLKFGSEQTVVFNDYYERFLDWREDVEAVFHASFAPASAKSTDKKSAGISGEGSLSHFELPRQLGAYRLESFLAEGGMGTVYRAVHLSMDRPVAFKLMQTQRIKSADALVRFQREMRAVAKLNHPNIVMAHDAGEVEGLHYLAMELVTGWDLARVCECCQTLPIPVACECIRQAAQGLQHVHEHGLVHRDIKPSNLMLTYEGQIKLLDLGLARLHEEEFDEKLTRESVPMGTVEYMAPEQARNPHAVDIRADLYSLGGCLFKLLCGVSPFSHMGRNAVQMLAAHMEEPPALVRDLRTEVPIELSDLVTRLLSKRPEDRPFTPSEVVAAIKPFAAPELLQAFAEGLRELTDENGALPKKPATSGIRSRTAIVPPSGPETRVPDTSRLTDDSDNTPMLATRWDRRRTGWALTALAVVAVGIVAWAGFARRSSGMDLLTTLDLERQSVAGSWSCDQSELLSPDEQIGCLRLVSNPAAEFRLELTAQLQEGGTRWAIVSTGDPAFALVFGSTVIASDASVQPADNDVSRHVWLADWGDVADSSARRLVVSIQNSQLTLERNGQIVTRATIPESGELDLAELPPGMLRRPGLYLLTYGSRFRFRNVTWAPLKAVGGER